MTLTIEQIHAQIKPQPNWQISINNGNIIIKVPKVKLPTGMLRLYISKDPLNAEAPIEISDDGDTLNPYQIPQVGLVKHSVGDFEMIPLTTGQWRVIQFRLNFGDLNYLPMTDELLCNTDLNGLNQKIHTFIVTIDSIKSQLPGDFDEFND